MASLKEERIQLQAALPQWDVVWETVDRVWCVRHPVCPWVTVQAGDLDVLIQRAMAVSWALGVPLPLGPVEVDAIE